ncbi:hypothetical protein [Saccharicrinis sp. FJH54]|uniref:hypothetical protein n=1 Tax=Saccharicrinis sp. FJH54 TaxID=3344665 RepID=UPI0035D51770
MTKLFLMGFLIAYAAITLISCGHRTCSDSELRFVKQDSEGDDLLFLIKKLQINSDYGFGYVPLVFVLEVHNNLNHDLNVSEYYYKYYIEIDTNSLELRYFDSDTIMLDANAKRFFRVALKYGYMPDYVEDIKKQLNDPRKFKLFGVTERDTVIIEKSSDFVLCK